MRVDVAHPKAFWEGYDCVPCIAVAAHPFRQDSRRNVTARQNVIIARWFGRHPPDERPWIAFATAGASRCGREFPELRERGLVGDAVAIEAEESGIVDVVLDF